MIVDKVYSNVGKLNESSSLCIFTYKIVEERRKSSIINYIFDKNIIDASNAW